MICFVIYGENIYFSKHKFNSFEKMYDILMIFVEIFHDFGWFFANRIRIRFIEADPDPADQNETDPYGSKTMNKSDIFTTFHKHNDKKT